MGAGCSTASGRQVTAPSTARSGGGDRVDGTTQGIEATCGADARVQAEQTNFRSENGSAEEPGPAVEAIGVRDQQEEAGIRGNQAGVGVRPERSDDSAIYSTESQRALRPSIVPSAQGRGSARDLASKDDRGDLKPSRVSEEGDEGKGAGDVLYPAVKSSQELVLEEACSVTGLTHKQMIEAAKSTKGLRGVTFSDQLPASSQFRGMYKIGKTLGRGAFSTVKLATHRETKEQFAVKIMNTGPSGKASLINVKQEIQILKELDHESIMKVVGAFTEGHKTYFVTECLPGGELLQSLVNRGTYTEEDAQACFVKLIKALEYIHGKGIVHRDIKLENLLLKDPNDVNSIKLIDFGMAKYVRTPELAPAVIGTPIYVAPEILEAATQPGRNPFSTAVDMWSAGVLLYILLAGFPPFLHDSEPALFDSIKKGSFTMDDPVWDNVSSEAKDLVRRLLEVDPAKRLNASQVLSHNWVTGGSGGAVLTAALQNMTKTLAEKLRTVMHSVVLLGAKITARRWSKPRESTDMSMDSSLPLDTSTALDDSQGSKTFVVSRSSNSVVTAFRSLSVAGANSKPIMLRRRTQSMKVK